MSSHEIDKLEQACQKVLGLPKIRFVGVLNKMGNKIAGGFKEGVTSFLPDKENRMMYVQLMLEYMMRKDFDAQLGILDQKSQVLKVKDISCEGGACDEKNDHTHDHKKKRKKIPRIYSFNLA
ncbi:MAG: hypothetical protein OEL81_04175 [Nitrosopumilus sp.]|nr:hypothetical protein [Nitrosopumilus sp.]MDH3488711.1 hypothetical protein [Nitrosopumilus sp.]